MLQLEWDGPQAGARVVFEFDAVERLQLEAAAEVTEHPVEQGANIADHVRPTNRTLRLEAWVTDTPVTAPTTAMDGATAAVGPTTLRLTSGGTVTATVLQLSTAVDRKRLAYATLEGLRTAGTVVTVRMPLDVVESCVVERFSVERTAETANVLAVQLDLKRVRIATTTRVPLDAPARRRDQPTQAHGPQPADPRSAAARLADTGIGRTVTGALGLGQLSH